MTEDNEAGSRSGFFGLWDVLAVLEEVSAWALTGRSVEFDALRLRLGVFTPEEMPLVRGTLRILLLVTNQIRVVFAGAGGGDAGRVPWPPDPSQLEDEAERLIDAAQNLSFLPGSSTTDGARHAIRRVLGFVSGSVALSDAQMELNVLWLDAALATLGPAERRRLQNAADVVFWAAVVLLSAGEDDSGGSGVDSGWNRSDQRQENE